MHFYLLSYTYISFLVTAKFTLCEIHVKRASCEASCKIHLNSNNLNVGYIVTYCNQTAILWPWSVQIVSMTVMNNLDTYMYILHNYCLNAKWQNELCDLTMTMTFVSTAKLYCAVVIIVLNDVMHPGAWCGHSKIKIQNL